MRTPFEKAQITTKQFNATVLAIGKAFCGTWKLNKNLTRVGEILRNGKSKTKGHKK